MGGTIGLVFRHKIGIIPHFQGPICFEGLVALRSKEGIILFLGVKPLIYL